MPNSSNARTWLTVKRLRAHGLILAVCLSSLYVWNMAAEGLRDRAGNLKGTDFLHFYTLGSLALAHRGADLYDMEVQAKLAAQRVPEAAGIRYLPLYPPQVSIFFSPLAHLSYGWALVVWLAVSSLIYGLCCYAVWRACPNLRENAWTVALLAVAFPAFFHLIAWGQTSALALGCFTLVFLLLRRERNFLAGLALGCLIFKPQLGLAAAVVFLSVAAWEIVAGAVLSAAAQFGIAWIYYGLGPLREWVRTLLHLRELLPLLEPRPYQTHSLRTLWSFLVPWPDLAFTLYLLSGFAMLALGVSCWRGRQTAPLGLRYPSLLLATVLVSPHLTVYDLVILMPAFLLITDWLIAQPASTKIRRLGGLLYLAYLSPLLGPLDTWTHLQISVIVMVVVLYMIWRMTRGISPASMAGV
jgi:hypothetical protein